jgi:uncharacterized protein YndB with AHSA1/START domain
MAELKHQIPIEASPDKVYAALATQAGLGSWWTADIITGQRCASLTRAGRLLPKCLPYAIQAGAN